MSFEETVDGLIAARIVYWMGGPYFALNLRETSRRCAALVLAPKKISNSWDIARTALEIGDSTTCLRVLAHRDDEDRESLLNYAARFAATYDRRDVLAYVFAHEPKDTVFHSESCAIRYAAAAGNLGLCEFIRDRIITGEDRKMGSMGMRACDLLQMVVGAIRENRRDLFEIGLKWCEEYTHLTPNLRDYIGSAAFHGHVDLCKFIRDVALERGQTIESEMILTYAAQGHSIEACKLAREWGARDFKMMMREAAGGTIEMCKLAREWLDASGEPYDASIFRDMMRRAVTHSVEMFRLAHDWFVAKSGRDLNLEEIRDSIMSTACLRDGAKISEFLYCAMQRYAKSHPGEETRARISAIVDEVMTRAVRMGDIETCKLMHSYGAVNYEMYLEEAVGVLIHVFGRADVYENEGARELVRGWMAKRDAAQ